MENLELQDDVDVVIVSVDGFPPRLLEEASTPFFDQVFEGGLTLTSCFATGYPTQMGLAGLVSSTLPLDYGGYDYGIRDRPQAIAETFQSAGYQTGAIVTGGWGPSSFQGYDRGFDMFRLVTNFGNVSRKLPKIYLGYGHDLIQSGRFSADHVTRCLSGIFKEILEWLREYALDRQMEVQGDATHPVHHAPTVHDWNFEQAEEILSRCLKKYERDPAGYTRRILEGYPGWGVPDALDQTREIDYRSGFEKWKRLWDTRELFLPLATREGSLWRAIGDPATAAEQIMRWRARTLWTSRPTGRWMLQNLASWIEQQPRPYFGWAHLLDIHDDHIVSHDLEGTPTVREEVTALRRSLNGPSTAENRGDWSVHKKLSTRYEDLVIERFYDRISEARGEPPLLVLTADHGLPASHRDRDHVVSNYEEQFHMATAFVHPDLPSETFDGLCSSMDVAPTLYQLLGRKVPEGFQGIPVQELPEEGREYVVSETFGRGPCDPTSKPVWIRVRTDERKVVCRSRLFDDGDVEVHRAVNLYEDPLELDPLEGSDVPSSFDPLIARARQRAEQIRQSMAQHSHWCKPYLEKAAK